MFLNLAPCLFAAVLERPFHQVFCKQLFNETETEAQIPHMPQRPANIKGKG